MQFDASKEIGDAPCCSSLSSKSQDQDDGKRRPDSRVASMVQTLSTTEDNKGDIGYDQKQMMSSFMSMSSDQQEQLTGFSQHHSGNENVYKR